MTSSTARKKANRARAQAATRVAALVTQQNGLCYWCHKPIAAVRQIARSALVHVDHEWIIYRVAPGVTEKVLRATVDHVTPLRDGIDNRWSNTVASCGPCNRRRTAPSSPKPAGLRTVCPKCGRQKPVGRRKCDTCRTGDPFRNKPRAANGAFKAEEDDEISTQ